jgi:hypothetical protein
MRDRQSRSILSGVYSMFSVIIFLAVLAMVLSSCSAELPVQRVVQQTDMGVQAVSYSIIFIIHGDGDYLYHDTAGQEERADEVALEGATTVALRNPRADVFIFHQLPRERFLFFSLRHDGEFFYYRNGRLIANELYWRDDEQARFGPEVMLYNRFHAQKDQTDVVRIFLYCGHEIPEFGGVGYDESYPDRAFTLCDLQAGLSGFTRDFGKFDLMILATCFGGTPYTINALGSFARTIIASPDNLYLSYFDLHALEQLDHGMHAENISAYAKQFAHRAFEKLAGSIQTSVSVAVYDVDSVQEFVRSVLPVYDSTLTSLQGESQASMLAAEHCDCGDMPAYTVSTMGNGVKVFYRPARFGRSKNKQSHSGWECWKMQEPQASSSFNAETVWK